jgi:hypothetical protein
MAPRVRFLVAAMIALLGFSGLLQGGGAQVATGTVTVQKYYCTYLEETLLVEAIDLAACSPGAATFTFYLVGDGTADYQQLVVGASGSGSINLPVGAYEMVEEGSQTFFNINVVAGENVQLLIGNPASVVVPTVPAPTAVPAQPTAVPVQPTAVPAQPPAAVQPTAAPPVKLPNTGSGGDPGLGLLPLALTVAAGLATGSALVTRGKRRG